MLMRFESFLITFAPPRTQTHTPTHTHADVYGCGRGIENTLYALWLCENSFNLKQIRNDNNDEIISYQHAKSERKRDKRREEERATEIEI